MKYLIPKGDKATHYRNKVIATVTELSEDKPWRVTIERYVKKRSNDQNSFLHAVPLRMICDETGHEMDDMKDYLLGTAFGWEEYEVMGSPRKRPVRRSSSLNTAEFTHFLEWIEAWAAQELGMIIPRPNETLEDV
jgi:hypothetical protein